MVISGELRRERYHLMALLAAKERELQRILEKENDKTLIGRIDRDNMEKFQEDIFLQRMLDSKVTYLFIWQAVLTVSGLPPACRDSSSRFRRCRATYLRKDAGGACPR